MVAEQARTQRSEHTARISQLEGEFRELKGNLKFLEHCNIVADSRYSLLVDEWDLRKLKFACCKACSAEMVQVLAIASKDVDAFIENLNLHAAHALKAVRDNFYSELVALAERLQTWFQAVSTFSKSVYEAAYHAVLLLQYDVDNCQTTVQEHLEQLTGQGGSQGGPCNSHGGPPSGAVDPYSRL